MKIEEVSQYQVSIESSLDEERDGVNAMDRIYNDYSALSVPSKIHLDSLVNGKLFSQPKFKVNLNEPISD